MNGDYLWNPAAAAPDPEIERLERSLRPYAYRPKPQRPRRLWLPVAAALVLTVAASLLFRASHSLQGWRITEREGDVRGPSSVLRPGESLVTGAAGRAALKVGLFGDLYVEPGSVVRLLESRTTRQRMALDRGAIRAVISAPPRLFSVLTPSATAVDLGCAYDLNVDAAGNGFLRVSMGWVSFEAAGRESFIPAGAACLTRKDAGPGTPFFTDASDSFQAALEEADFHPDPARRLAARRQLVSAARPRDVLTLWHLLSRGTEPERALAFDRLAELRPLPPGVTREAVLSLDRNAIDKLWNALDLGPTAWWRLWKGPAPPSPR